MSRPRCGNDPRAQLTDGDRQAVESFKAYLADRAALRDRIAEAALSAVEAALGDTLLPAAREEALAGIAAVLPPPVSRAAVYRELADQQEQTAATDVIRRRRSIATARRLFAVELRRMADEAQPGKQVVPCVRPEPHVPHLHSGLHKGVAVHGRCPGVPTTRAQQDEAQP